ncbi:MAG: hypothetical protein IE922_00570 [Sphingomonadales bacterium]|nr:hypothetical protein [Sphingomonadales bacterium]
MQNLRKVSIVAATFLLAAATGHVMQTAQGPMPATDPAALQPVPVPAADPMATGVQVTGLTISEVAALPQLPTRPLSPEALRADPALPAEPAVQGFQPACAPATLSLGPMPRGLVSVALSAPCDPGGTVTLRQGPMGFAARLDATGRWSGVIPALGPEVSVAALLPSGEGLDATRAVAGTDLIDRMILLWTGPAAIHLNAYEYGSAYGGAGHIFAAAPRTPDTPLGGYMLAYGDGAEGPHAEVYSAPAAMTDIRFDLEAPVTAASCGRDLQAQVLHVRAGRFEAPVQVTFAMPDCAEALQPVDGAEAGADPGGSVVLDLPQAAVSLAATN